MALAIAIATTAVIGGPAVASVATGAGDSGYQLGVAAESSVGESMCVRTADALPFTSGSEILDCDPPAVAPPSGPIAEPAIDTTGTRRAVGGAPDGLTYYPAPADAVIVASSGSDNGSGTLLSPFKTITRAIDRAPTGSTIVIRGGSYPESVTVPREKRLTIQPFAGEEVWLDGSRSITSWQWSGALWFTSGWTVEFDASPTYKRGAADNSAAGWSFLNPARPLAAHPDQVWFGATAQRQVGSIAEVTSGDFFVDSAADRIYVGSDPTAQQVRASALSTALRVLSADSVVRGIGVRRYAPSVPDMGAVSVYGARVKIADMRISDNATTGLSVNAGGVAVSSITVARNGMLGMHANYADGLVVTDLLSADNNTEGFNRAPVSGGLKITRSRSVSVIGSAFLNNDGNALWFDESVYDGRVVGNDVLSNSGNAVVVELSARFVVADNVIADNGLNGVLIDGSGTVDVWNNTIVGNDRAVKVAQGDRRASDLATAGHDPRQPQPDPTVTWITEKITLSNNILSTASGNCIVGVEDYSHERSAQQMAVTANGNVYQRAQVSRPAWAIVWSRGLGDPAVYTSVAKFTAATGQEQQTLVVEGTDAIRRSGWTPTEVVRAAAPRMVQPLPGSVIAATGKNSAGGVLGAWLD